MTILPQSITIDAETLIKLMSLCYEYDANMDDTDFVNQYGNAGFYYSMGKSFALRDLFDEIGLHDAYKMYERTRDTENAYA